MDEGRSITAEPPLRMAMRRERQQRVVHAADELADLPQVVITAEVHSVVIAWYPPRPLLIAALIEAEYLRRLRDARDGHVPHEGVYRRGPGASRPENLLARPPRSGSAAKEIVAVSHLLILRDEAHPPSRMSC